MSEQITLYTAKICPYAHRAEIALEEAGIPYSRYEIDLSAKPEWFAPKVNPASKVPAIAYGGPSVAPENPSPESVKIAESLVILEFINDISGGRLLPTDPVGRARARFFINFVSTTFIPAFQAVALRGEQHDQLFAALEKVQALLPPQGFAAGAEFGIADAAIAPFFGRLEVALNGIGDEPGLQAFQRLRVDPAFERYRRYWADVKARKSYHDTFDEAYMNEQLIKRVHAYRGQNASAH